MVGRTLSGRYTIIAKLGSGSMGTVYRAKQHAMGREVAIKILRGDRADDETAKARFMREARANSLLASPNTVTVFDFGQSESGEFYLAMELLEGESLGQRLTRVGRLPVAVAVEAARQALRSLSEAHAKGIIHRDLKPDNLFFARMMTSACTFAPNDGHEEIVKVLDFGIAKMLKGSDKDPIGVIETQAGTVFGTPRYMSPEQAQGKPLDARTDLYSLGVILYQMLTGRPPFTDNDAVVVMARHIKSVPKRLNEANPDANIPKELEDVVLRTLSKDPADRPPTADVLASELLEAQGATSSGVRASVMNVAGIHVPESMRPPPLAPSPSRWTIVAGVPVALIVAAVPVIVLVAAAGVYLGLRSGRSAATTPETAPANVSEVGSSTPSSTASTIAPATIDPPTVTPDALPTAPRERPPALPQKGVVRSTTKGVAPRASNVKAPPASAPTSSYGIFE